MISLDPPRGVPEGADPWRFLGLSRAGLAHFTRSAQQAIGLPGSVEVLLTSDDALRHLNRTFRGKNKPTDILSFPAAPQPGVPLADRHAGDLAVSLQTAARQAQEHGHPLRDEIRILLLHGLLHLHGMDHESDSGQMASREGELRARFRLPSGLIARGTRKAHPAGIATRKNASPASAAPGRTQSLSAKSNKAGQSQGRLA